MSRRRLLLLAISGVVTLLALLAAVLFAAGQPRWGAALLALLAGMVAVLLVDVWRRQRDVAHMLRVSAERQREIGTLLATIIGSADAEADAASVRNSMLGRVEAAERRVLDAISAAEIRAARGAAPPVSETDPAATDG